MMDFRRFLQTLFVLILFWSMDNHEVKGDTRCPAKANVIFLVPGQGENTTSHEWFTPMEFFLHGVTNYFNISENLFNVGFMLYGRSAKAMSEIRPYRNRTQINTRLSLLSHQADMSWILTGTASLPLALIEVMNMFKRAEVERQHTGSSVTPQNIAVIILNGTYVGNWRSLELAKELKERGITLYTVLMSDVRENANLARKLATDDCKMYIIHSETGPYSMREVVREIGNNICMATNPEKSFMAEPDVLKNCPMVTEYFPPKLTSEIECQEHESVHADVNNCAYFYKCKNKQAYRLRCRMDTLFDPVSLSCNHKEAVSCFSQVTCPFSTGLFPYPGSCTKYLNCYNGLTYIQSCPPTLLFNPDIKLCVRPENAFCPYEDIKEPAYPYL